MPNRIIKESICSSDDINELSWFEECFWYRLIVTVDDYGCYDARIPILKARLFPLKDITSKQVQLALNKLVTVGMVRVYEYDRQPFLQLLSWERHQTIRAKRRKYPSYEQSLQEKESICTQMNADEINCTQMNADVHVIQSESESESESNTCVALECDLADGDGFSIFWKSYPKKIGKGAAEKAYKKIKPNKALQEQMINALNSAKKSKEWIKEDGRYIPNPLTWLNQKRWQDELTLVTNGKSNTVNYDEEF